MHANVLRPSLLLLVLVTSASEALADTRAVHQAGRCNLTEHDWPKNPLEVKVTAKAALPYKVRLGCGPFVGGEWAISAPLFVANGTGKMLHMHYFIAFFDSDDRLVGCCNQGTQVKPGGKELQLASCVIEGPKERLLTAVKYQITIYESDQWIGQEPISAKDAAARPGRAGAVTTTLTGVALKKDTKDGVTALHLSADCSFHEPDKKTRDTHVEIEGGGLRDVYLSTREGVSGLSDDIHGKKKPIVLRRWLIDVNREVKRPGQGVRGRGEYVALVDRKGRLVVCGRIVGFSTHDLVAPKDRLLSAASLRMVVYESIAAGAKKDKQGSGR